MTLQWCVIPGGINILLPIRCQNTFIAEMVVLKNPRIAGPPYEVTKCSITEIHITLPTNLGLVYLIQY